MKHTIDPKLCVMCDACRPACPRQAVSVHESEKTYVINPNLCNNCQNMSSVRCVPHCPVDAIKAPASA